MESLVLVAEFVFELATSLTSSTNCLEFCSNVLAVFTPVFDMCLDISFACFKAGFHDSKVEKITLFESLTADTVLSATLLTNLVYALAAASGEKKLVTNPLKISLYGLHTDWSELTTCF